MLNRIMWVKLKILVQYVHLSFSDSFKKLGQNLSVMANQKYQSFLMFSSYLPNSSDPSFAFTNRRSFKTEFLSKSVNKSTYIRNWTCHSSVRSHLHIQTNNLWHLFFYINLVYFYSLVQQYHIVFSQLNSDNV